MLLEIPHPSALIEARFLATTRNFFAIPHAEKMKHARSEQNPWGYNDSELTKNRQDWKEIFDLGLDQDSERYQSRTPWPTRPAEFRTVMLDWFTRCESISFRLLDAISDTLDLPPEPLRQAFTPTHSSFLRLNRYPICETPADSAEDFPETGNLGIYHHTDAGALTVLLQDDVSGLQVRRDGQWHTVTAGPGGLIINVGDLVQVWSNDRYRAPLHRVLANDTFERYSAAFFFNPSVETDCIPLVDAPARYERVNWGEFRSSRAAGDYANLGEETQISDYRIQAAGR